MLTLMILLHFKGTNAMTKAEIIDKLATLEEKVAQLAYRLDDMQADIDDDSFPDEFDGQAHAINEEVYEKIALELYRFAKYPNGPTAKKWRALLTEGKFRANKEAFCDAVEEEFFNDTF